MPIETNKHSPNSLIGFKKRKLCFYFNKWDKVLIIRDSVVGFTKQNLCSYSLNFFRIERTVLSFSSRTCFLFVLFTFHINPKPLAFLKVSQLLVKWITIIVCLKVFVTSCECRTSSFNFKLLPSTPYSCR